MSIPLSSLVSYTNGDGFLHITIKEKLRPEDDSSVTMSIRLDNLTEINNFNERHVLEFKQNIINNKNAKLILTNSKNNYLEINLIDDKINFIKKSYNISLHLSCSCHFKNMIALHTLLRVFLSHFHINDISSDYDSDDDPIN